MDSIGEYVWAILAIILTVASLLKSSDKRKRQHKEASDTEMQLDEKFGELRKNINIETIGESRQKGARHPKSDIQQKTDVRKQTAKRPKSAAANINMQDAANGQYTASATIAQPTTKTSDEKMTAAHSETVKTAESEKCGTNAELGRKFNLRDAIVYSEIMKPKFEE